MSHKNVRVRIAPSPTGDPHVGTAYVGLINYVFARQHQGQLILRIEDTDQTRSSPVFEEGILKSLSWFGITWDEGPDKGGPCGPYRQSERTDIYREHAARLLSNGGAYRCFCTAERLDRMRAERREQKQNITGYDRHCRDLPQEEIERLLEANTPYVIRLKMPIDGETVVNDRLRGEVRFRNDLVDDQILLKSDGFPTYHFANVVDDHLMGVSHVIRAEEWINSTPKHLVLYEAFGWEPPEFVHISLLRNQDRSKISKRKNPVSLVYYEELGILPEAMRNFLALMGWIHPSGNEKFTTDEMIETFKLEALSLGGPIFNIEKLKWLNGLYIRELSGEALLSFMMKSHFSPTYLEKILPLVRERMEIFEDFWKYGDYFYFTPSLENPATLVPSKRTPPDTRKLLLAALEKLEEVSKHGWEAQALEAGMRQLCEEAGWKASELFMSLRIAITGKTATPPLFDTMAVLGKERVRTRLKRASDALQGLK